MIDLIKDLLSHLFKGMNRVIAVFALFLMGADTAWVFATEEEHSKALRLILPCGVISLFAGLAMFGSKMITERRHRFGKDETGVLVLQLAGDKANFFQRDFVSSLNNQLSKTGIPSGIKVRAWDLELDDTKLGVSAAHKKARDIGQRFNALIVLWGNYAEGKKFWLRITIVKQAASAPLIDERQLNVQALMQTELPEALVSEPVYLAFFLSALSSYNAGRFAEALTGFESALHLTKTDRSDIPFLKLHIANSRYCLALSHNQPQELLKNAIQDYQFALAEFDRLDSKLQWARTLNNFAAALEQLAGFSDETEALQLLDMAVKAYRSSLVFRTRAQFPQDWATTQLNLGNALSTQAERSRGTEALCLLVMAEGAYRMALEVWTRDQSPQLWITAQNNLGLTLVAQSEHHQQDKALQLLSNGVVAFRAALNSFTRDRFKDDWAMTQSHLGLALVALAKAREESERLVLLNEAVEACREALSIYTRNEFPIDWAMTQNSLGLALVAQAERSERIKAMSLLSAAVTAYLCALEVMTTKEFTHQHNAAKENLAKAESALRLLSNKHNP